MEKPPRQPMGTLTVVMPTGKNEGNDLCRSGVLSAHQMAPAGQPPQTIEWRGGATPTGARRTATDYC
ncbi:unnamed protein product [Pieris brassicae]|uniref:Uncharacterized protein n=1 Tax=Pieris brassicae TaxID=7116 RepID=A0A9P0TCX3_PIEBR|nr:unnamed protein product [Pieris brassicae]